MKIVSMITEHNVIDAILRHLARTGGRDPFEGRAPRSALALDPRGPRRRQAGGPSVGAGRFTRVGGRHLLGDDPRTAPSWVAAMELLSIGYANADGMAADDDLKSLRGDPAFEIIVARARKNQGGAK